MPEENASTRVIEARGFRFPGAEAALPAEEFAELGGSGQEDALAKTAVSVARPADRVMVLGGGSGLVPAVLAGRLGVRHLAVVEPEAKRRAYMDGVLAANSLVRATLHDAAPADFGATMLVCDLSRSAQIPFPAIAAGDGLRAVVLRLPEARPKVARIFERMSAGGLTYFPRQSSGIVVTFLSRWH